MTRAIVALLLVCTTVVHAAPRTVMVLRAEGTADAATRATIEAHILRIAKNLDGKVEAGDITLSDAAAAAGCSTSAPTCKDEILATFGVDELVATMVSATAAGNTVTVRRLQKNTAPKAAASTIAPGKRPEPKLDHDIGPLFGAGIATTPLTDGGTAPAVTQPPQPPHDVHTQPTAPVGPSPEDNAPAPMATTPSMQPAQPAPVDAPAPDRRWQKIGMGVGAGLVLLSFVMWTQASTKQEQIDTAPHDTPADFNRLRDLEREADGLAGGGNLFFLAGVVLGGVSGYYYWKKGRAARAQTARITPTVFPHGAGVVLTFGGSQ